MVLTGVPENVWSLGLDRVRLALDRLDHPERSYRHILVAGTNGKGSTCIYLERILAVMGVRVGTTMSPHISRITERFRIDSSNVSEAALEEAHSRAKPLLGDIGLTYFEWCVVMAALVFQMHRVEYGIFEIGLGGRYDASNVMDPLVSLITDVSLDHMQYLGSTIPEIAGEKACIARPGRPLITTAGGPALDAIQDHARRVGAVLQVVETPLEYPTAIRGSRQGMNAALALAAARQLGFEPGESQVRYALKTSFLPGRIEEVGKRVILDVAHNPAAMAVLVEHLERRSFHGSVVFGALADKDFKTMVEMMKKISPHIYIAPVRTERSWGAAEMAACLDGDRVVQCASISDACRRALATGEEVVITGSFYTVGEVREGIVCTGN